MCFLGVTRQPQQKFRSNPGVLPTCFESPDEYEESQRQEAEQNIWSDQPEPQQQQQQLSFGEGEPRRPSSADCDDAKPLPFSTSEYPPKRVNAQNYSSEPIRASENPSRRLNSKKFGSYPVGPGSTNKPTGADGKLNLHQRGQGKGQGVVVPPPGLSHLPSPTSTAPVFNKSSAPQGLDGLGHKTRSRNNTWPPRGKYRSPSNNYSNNMNDKYSDQDMWSATTVATYGDLMDVMEAPTFSTKQPDKVAPKQLEFLEMIGNGTHAEVFLGLLASGRDGKQVEVAVKMFHPGFGAFNRGNQVLALEHKNLVKSFLSVHSDSAQSFFMEHCNAGSLQKFIAVSHKKLALVQRLKILLDVSKGMEHLHENGITHADLKTSNILLNTKDPNASEDFSAKDFTAKVSDYAFQTIRRTPGTYLAAEYGHQSWRYQAPEVFRGEVTEKSDIFSFGTVIYEVFMGQMPFSDIAPPQMPGDHLAGGKRPSAEAMIPNSSVLMVGLTKRCWDQDPNRRPSFREVSRFLENQLNLCRMYEFMKGQSV